MRSREEGFIWITEILNSGYSEDERYLMASKVVQLLGNHFFPEVLVRLHYLQPAEVPPLLDFLSLCEKFYATESPPHPGSIALRILSIAPEYADFGPTILPVLSSTLLPTHPLQSRSLALGVFHRFMPGWFSSQMENIPSCNELLQAVGDPFQFIPNLPLQDGGSSGTVNDESVKAVAVLIEFASSDLWRNHLSRSNFTSCEKLMSMEEGRRIALGCMLDTATRTWPAYLRTPAKITAAVRRLEELQCLSTAEVVILWAWTTGVIDAANHDDWRLIERATLKFYQTHGMGRLATLKHHIIDTDWTIEDIHLEFLLERIATGYPCRVERVRRRPMTAEEEEENYVIDLRISQICQSRKLYRLFEHDPTTRTVAVEVDEMDLSSGSSGASVSFMDLACDYP